MLSLPSDQKTSSNCLVVEFKYTQMVPSFNYLNKLHKTKAKDNKRTAQNKCEKDSDPSKSRVSISIIK